MPDTQARAGGKQHRAILRQGLARNRRFERRAAQCDQRGLLEQQLRADDGAFERRRVGAVADERVGQPVRHRVHGAAGHDAQVL